MATFKKNSLGTSAGRPAPCTLVHLYSLKIHLDLVDLLENLLFIFIHDINRNMKDNSLRHVRTKETANRSRSVADILVWWDGFYSATMRCDTRWLKVLCS